jgi:hypothetical protein
MLEIEGIKLNYHSIFIALATGANVKKLFYLLAERQNKLECLFLESPSTSSNIGWLGQGPREYMVGAPLIGLLKKGYNSPH